MSITTKEVKDSLKREKEICEVAIRHLRKDCSVLEKKYKMLTDDFMKKFKQGKLGDGEDFFKWYALVEGIRDWMKRRTALQRFV